MDSGEPYTLLYDESRFTLLFDPFDRLVLLYSRIFKNKMVYTDLLDTMFDNFLC